MKNSRMEMIRQANEKRRISPEYKIDDLVKVHHSGISRPSWFS